ncbi:MAG TPA: PilC/PilY family type IV pilus protein [Solimonas sp.]|nr:PilC/PilY family type IV pilus protein [Solimonas sp.]
MKRKKSFATVSGLCLGLLTMGSAHADIPLSSGPLFLSASVDPNVMLLFDNSGSMRNMIFADGYNPGTTYRDWSQACGSSSTDSCWSATDTIVEQSEIPRGTCPSGWQRGRKESGGNQAKCLKLPFPLVNGSTNITRYTGNYLNYLFETFPNNTDLTVGNLIPQETRITVAKNVATNLVNANAELRWGLARFNATAGSNNGPGGRVIANCGSTIGTVTGAISGIAPDTNTPLAETYYEITRYFRGMGSQYNSGVSYTSPIQYRCQKNFALVVTDGFPTYDDGLPTNDPDDTADTTRALPNWDGRTGSPATTAAMYPLFPRYSDGFKGQSGSEGNEGYTLLLDDVAKFGFDTDMRKTGNDASGVSFNDPNFPVQRLETYTVGLAIDNQMLRDAAEYGNGQAYTARNASELTTALTAALNDIASRTSAAASVATNSTRLTADTAIYQARFNTGDWSGELLALPVNNDGSVGTPLWNAAQQIPAENSRAIFTFDPTASPANRGKVFEFNQLNASQQAALDLDALGVDDNRAQDRVDYLRGDRSDEGTGAGQFRLRNAATVLGDIVNSDPAFVGDQDFGFSKLPGTEGATYAGFLGIKKAREPMIYVGANDGMLHGFRGSDGVELFAYVPNAIYSKLSKLTAQNYNIDHQYFVDGAARPLDAYIGGDWESVVLGSLAGGGRGVFALNVTDPSRLGRDSVMWEFSSANDSDMGFSYPQPTIARMANGRWAAIIANGYNSTSGKAVLFVLDLETGNVIARFDTGVGGDNGMSSPIPADIDGDRIADLIYAGDLKGNLWKIDVRDSNPSNWKFGFGTAASPQPLFVACADNGCSARQPITARPEVGINPAGGFIVYFGTGRYFASTDNQSGMGGDNSFYGVFDKHDGTRPSGRSALLQQSVLATVTGTFGGRQETVRITSNTPLDPASHQGWLLDLPLNDERQVSTPILRGGAIIFTTLIPNTEICGFGGDSFLMEIDALSGSRLESTPFDLNRDTAFNSDDQVIYNGERVPVSGRLSKEGIIKTPAIISAGAFEIKLASGTTGGIDTTIEPGRGGVGGGRLSWRQMQ